MIKSLKLTNVGPAPSLELNDLGERLNLISGDNGLGKSFLLDAAWWALTRKWPAEINEKLVSGKIALPRESGEATIGFRFSGKSKENSYASSFDRKNQKWKSRPGRPANPGLVLYAMADGSFALWDPARNYWNEDSANELQVRPSAYVFDPRQIWDGLPGEKAGMLCNGLIQDWASWQKENGKAFQRLKDVLAVLSPSKDEPLVPGEFTRISLDDVRDIPTLKMPYGQDVAVVHASSGVRRIIALAYLLVWAWEEHIRAASMIDEFPTQQIVFLVDEIEAHLHPKWQRKIIPALLGAVDGISNGDDVNSSVHAQILAVTHSPMIMASVEPLFDARQDAWFDLDLEQGNVVLAKREFEHHGSIENWVTSDAFDLRSGRAVEYELLIEEAGQLLEQEAPSRESMEAMNRKLVDALNPQDPYLITWRFLRDKLVGKVG